MRRLPDWPERLAQYVEANSNRRFQWGTLDCMTFANGAVEAMTGHRIHSNSWSGYRTAKEAYRVMGGPIHRFVARIAREQGWSKVHPRSAMRGDLVIVKQANRLTVAVSLGQFCVSPGVEGLSKVPFAWARVAWRI